MTLAQWMEENPRLFSEWDEQANINISPDSVSYGSKKKAWWRCEKGHSWQARVDSITSGAGCPYCAGKRVTKGENDLQSSEPSLATEWCDEKNALSPDEISRGSKKKAFWKCEKGHEWQATVYSRSGKQNAKCPYCSNYRVLEGFNDLQTTDPHLASEWCDELNGDLKPSAVMRGSHKKVWWKCSEGHVWEAYIFARSKPNGTGCPICSGRYKQKNDA